MNNIHDKDVSLKYTESFYFAVATICVSNKIYKKNYKKYKILINIFYNYFIQLIGSNGDTMIETIYVTLVVLLTVGVFAYLVSTIGMILEGI